MFLKILPRWEKSNVKNYHRYHNKSHYEPRVPRKDEVEVPVRSCSDDEHQQKCGNRPLFVIGRHLASLARVGSRVLGVQLQNLAPSRQIPPASDLRASCEVARYCIPSASFRSPPEHEPSLGTSAHS